MAFHPEFLKSFYLSHLADGTVHGEEIRARCPGHDDNKPSFSANYQTGLFNCLTPGCPLHGGGNVVKFMSFIEDIPYTQAEKQIQETHDAKFPPVSKAARKAKSKSKFPHDQKDIEEMCAALLANPEKLQFLKDECLWNEETIKKFEIGYSLQDNAYWIPIKENVTIHNIRKYRP